MTRTGSPAAALVHLAENAIAETNSRGTGGDCSPPSGSLKLSPTRG